MRQHPMHMFTSLLMPGNHAAVQDFELHSIAQSYGSAAAFKRFLLPDDAFTASVKVQALLRILTIAKVSRGLRCAAR